MIYWSVQLTRDTLIWRPREDLHQIGWINLSAGIVVGMDGERIQPGDWQPVIVPEPGTVAWEVEWNENAQESAMLAWRVLRTIPRGKMLGWIHPPTPTPWLLEWKPICFLCGKDLVHLKRRHSGPYWRHQRR